MKEFYGTFKRDYLRNILVVNYKGVTFLLQKSYEIEFLPKSDYVSCLEARKQIKSEIARNLEIRKNQEMEKINIAFERKKEEFIVEYPFMVEGGMVKYNPQMFGEKLGESQEEIKDTIWKIDGGEYIARFKKNDRYWYCCRFKDGEIYIREQLGL